MSETQALLLTGTSCMVAMVVVMVGAKLLGGGRELIACFVPLFVCVSALGLSSVVVRYGGKDRRR